MASRCRIRYDYSNTVDAFMLMCLRQMFMLGISEVKACVSPFCCGCSLVEGLLTYFILKPCENHRIREQNQRRCPLQTIGQNVLDELLTRRPCLCSTFDYTGKTCR